jgi:hypothetical protein
MTMRMRIARLFTIKTRTEVWLVIYALAMGAVERGRHYLEVYPGNMGIVLALLCTGVVFLAGAKLLDSVTPAKLAPAGWSVAPRSPRRPELSRSRPRLRQTRFGSRSPLSRRTGSRPTTRR